jgi:hypothetical protein
VRLLPNNATAKNYTLTNGESYALRGQRIEKATPDTSHLDFARSISVAYDGKQHGTQDATLLNDSELRPVRPGTVCVTAYTAHDDNYENADTVRRKLIITDAIKVTVTFYTGDGGSIIPPVKVAKADTVGKPAEPERGNLVFGGWYADKEYKSEWRFSEHKVTQDTTLYARWGYHVTFNANGGKPSIRDTVVSDGDTASEPVPPTQPGTSLRVGTQTGFCTHTGGILAAIRYATTDRSTPSGIR